MQLEWVRRGHGVGLMPMRLFSKQRLQGVTLLETEKLDLSMQVVVLRSPHIHRLTKVAEAIAGAVGSVVNQHG